MKWFRRREATPPTPDEGLPFLSVEEATELRLLIRQTFGEHGLEVEMFADHLVDSDGAEFNYWNLGIQCGHAPRRRWPTLVHDHIGLLLRTMSGPDPFDSLTPAEAQAQVHCRLHELDGLTGLDKIPHREFLPGVVEMLALDLPEAIATFNRDNVDRFGGWESLREHGLANLRALPVDKLVTLRGPRESVFHALVDANLHTGSRALVVEHVMRACGQEPGRHGWLLAVPNRHQVAWHVVDDISVLGAIEAMATFAVLGHRDGASPISPHVYWWNGEFYEQLTHSDDEGRLTVHVSERLQSVLEDLANR